ncbi:glycoside hydrolase family 130 protein [bacterium]|nr:glycoside hydrolase family 130 protein [bacterium]
MSNSTIIGTPLPNIPWQDKPKGCRDVVWRYSNNPVIRRDAIPGSNSIFNSAVVPFSGKFVGVFRCDDTHRESQLHVGWSADGINWDLEPERIHFQCDDPEIAQWHGGYDPRVVWIDDRFYVTWCNQYHGPTIGVAYTHDFKTFTQLENAFIPYNRNGVLFPRKINGNFAILSRPSDTGHTPFGDIFYSETPDMTYWGRHRHVMRPNVQWQSTKIGAGPIPIETNEGWLLIFHGVLTSCNGMVYQAGAALLDLDEPWKVIYKGARFIMAPRELYECVGDVPNVVFPCAALTDPATGRIAVYYGAADTVTGLAFCNVDELIEFIKEDSRV